MAINVNLNFHKIEKEWIKNLNQRIGHELDRCLKPVHRYS